MITDNDVFAGKAEPEGQKHRDKETLSNFTIDLKARYWYNHCKPVDGHWKKNRWHLIRFDVVLRYDLQLSKVADKPKRHRSLNEMESRQ